MPAPATETHGCSRDHNPDIEDDSENDKGDDATMDVLTDHIYRDRPQVSRRRAIWSMIGRLSQPFLEAGGLHSVQLWINNEHLRRARTYQYTMYQLSRSDIVLGYRSTD